MANSTIPPTSPPLTETLLSLPPRNPSNHPKRPRRHHTRRSLPPPAPEKSRDNILHIYFWVVPATVGLLIFGDIHRQRHSSSDRSYIITTTTVDWRCLGLVALSSLLHSVGPTYLVPLIHHGDDHVWIEYGLIAAWFLVVFVTVLGVHSLGGRLFEAYAARRASWSPWLFPENDESFGSYWVYYYAWFLTVLVLGLEWWWWWLMSIDSEPIMVSAHHLLSFSNSPWTGVESRALDEPGNEGLPNRSLPEKEKKDHQQQLRETTKQQQSLSAEAEATDQVEEWERYFVVWNWKSRLSTAAQEEQEEGWWDSCPTVTCRPKWIIPGRKLGILIAASILDGEQVGTNQEDEVHRSLSMLRVCATTVHQCSPSEANVHVGVAVMA
ncbi:hypothetical protein QBC35DRAFT_528385 [Podospora australis]|uniref:Uncharacterized protein n=1 Tax=Podospora australis TaxID=1536484 RepID=A0AAN6X2N8_9PEZI|nr:hypothetical protein QBC35DRAFT_528385 [Podospora australis]